MLPPTCLYYDKIHHRQPKIVLKAMLKNAKSPMNWVTIKKGFKISNGQRSIWNYIFNPKEIR